MERENHAIITAKMDNLPKAFVLLEVNLELTI